MPFLQFTTSLYPRRFTAEANIATSRNCNNYNDYYDDCDYSAWDSYGRWQVVRQRIVFRKLTVY